MDIGAATSPCTGGCVRMVLLLREACLDANSFTSSIVLHRGDRIRKYLYDQTPGRLIRNGAG